MAGPLPVLHVRTGSGGLDCHLDLLRRSGPRHAHGTRNGGGVTKSQAKAISAIADRGGLDAAQEAHDPFGVALEELTVKQANELIDAVKNQAPARNGSRR